VLVLLNYHVRLCRTSPLSSLSFFRRTRAVVAELLEVTAELLVIRLGDANQRRGPPDVSRSSLSVESVARGAVVVAS